MGAVFTQDGSVWVYSCTVVDNLANSGGGFYVADDLSGIQARNCIVWNNAGGSATLIDPVLDNGLFPSFSRAYSNVQGEGTAGIGNIDEDPGFQGGSYNLGAGSPCIDAGNSQLVDDFPEDVAGNIRGANDPFTVDTGISSLGVVVDMGCYEYQVECEAGEPCPGDTNSDNVVNLADLLQVIGNWGVICP